MQQFPNDLPLFVKRLAVLLKQLQLLLKLRQIESHSVGAWKAVVRFGICGIEIDERHDTFRMPSPYRTQFLPGNGMPDKQRLPNLECIEHREHIVAEPVGRVSSSGTTGCTVSSPCDAINVILIGQLGREVIEYVCGIAEARQEKKRLACTTPIQNLKLYVRVHCYKLDRVR